MVDRWDRDSIVGEIDGVLAKYADRIEHIDEGADFQADLNMDSVTIFNIVVEIEERFDIFLQDAPNGPPRNIAELIDCIQVLLIEGDKGA